MSTLFYIGPVLGWCSTEETRVLVDVTNNVTLTCELYINNEGIVQLVADAEPGIPVIYIIYNMPLNCICRIVWNGEVEIEFKVKRRFRIHNEVSDEFPLIKYIRCDFAQYLVALNTVYLPTPLDMTYLNEKVILVSGNCHYQTRDVRYWERISHERPGIIIHVGGHINYKRLLDDDVISIKQIWRKIRDLYHESWDETQIKSVMATTCNIFTTDSKTFQSYNLIRINGDELTKLAKSIFDPGNSSVDSITLKYDDIIWLTTMMYQEVLWRDIPHTYEGGYKHFALGIKFYFILDNQYHRTYDTFFGLQQLSNFENDVSKLISGSDIFVITSANPFRATPKLISIREKLKPDFQNRWGYRRKWINEYIRIISNSQHYRITFIGGGSKELMQQLYLERTGIVIRNFIVPPVRTIDYGKLKSMVLKRRFWDYEAIYTQIRSRCGFLMIDNETCYFITDL